jgi:hypothetical protein
MGEVITYYEKEVPSKGLNKHNKIQLEKLKEFVFEEDLERLQLLKQIKPINLPVEMPTLFYPGCGVDILFPLMYVKELFKINECNMIFVDMHDARSILKTVLDDVGISMIYNEDKISFYWENILVHLKFIKKDVAEMLDDLPEHHIYFERAFRIMRDRIPEYENKILSKLHDNGVLISDSGFEKLGLKYIDVPKELSSYGEMVIGIKNK